jgi:YD repeat-containing protein
MTDPKGQVVDYTYDELDRVKTVAYKNAVISGAQLSFDYNYDAEDNVTEVKETDSINQIKNYARKYDARNRLTEEKDSRQNIVNYVYDATNNVKQITARNYYNSTQTTKETNYTYDALNRLDTVSAGGGAQVAKYNWTADGLLDEVVYQGNASTKRKFSYDNADRVTNITNTIGTNTESFDYGYDGNSNRTSETRKFNGTTTRTITNGCDVLDRLASSSSIAPPTERRRR